MHSKAEAQCCPFEPKMNIVNAMILCEIISFIGRKKFINKIK